MNPFTPLDRRSFLRSTAMAGVGMAMLRPAHGAPAATVTQDLFRKLLGEWGRGLLGCLIENPQDPARHGALRCPACAEIHGRCMDAVYPFLHLARHTSDPGFLVAAKRVVAWAETNVSQADGSWTVIRDPKSWKGITVFGMIALAEALHHHGDLLDGETRSAWMARLRRAADYVQREFTIDFTNINYPASAVYGLHLCGKLLDEPAFPQHARLLAAGVREHFTTPNKLLFGEGKPSRGRSAKGLYPVDLGYNVEESLVALSLYAVDAGDHELKNIVVDSWRAHLEFMLPDGAWDNSWGTRQAKWSYWGSRTCDGCQPGLAVLADADPAFATAARLNTELMAACTRDGLLHGGPHYAVHGTPPCVHHTFTHAKALAAVLDRRDSLERLDAAPPARLPRSLARGIRAFPEISTWLVAGGPWRGTISSYDFIYKTGVLQATGGALSMLWHESAGPVFAGSMPRYVKVEPNNMQDDPDGRDDPLTPRVESRVNGTWFTNLFDLEAIVTSDGENGKIKMTTRARLRDKDQRDPESGPASCEIGYEINGDELIISARMISMPEGFAIPSLILPVIATSGEKITRVDENHIHMEKSGGMLSIMADSPLMMPGNGKRIFNLTPGFEAALLEVKLDANRTSACRLRMDR